MRGPAAAVLVLGLVLLAAAILLRRSPGEPAVPGSAVPPAPAPSTPEAPPAATPVPAPAPPALRKVREDARLDAWYRAVSRKDAPGVLEAQAVLLASEDETRGPLQEIASGDPDPRMRAFSTAVLGRMKRPPPPAFFAARLGDTEPGPRIAALAALEKVGTRAELAAVEACSAPEEVRQAAERTAAVLRSR